MHCIGGCYWVTNGTPLAYVSLACLHLSGRSDRNMDKYRVVTNGVKCAVTGSSFIGYGNIAS